jgi:surfeit locus 1 family protein
MRLPRWLWVILVAAGTVVCVRLGFWQLARLHEKRVLHAVQHAALAESPIEVVDSLPARSPEAGHRVRVSGEWDGSAHVLLSGRSHLGAAGVSLVSALRLASGEAVLVERGWLAAADSRSAQPGPAAPGRAQVTGVALPLVRKPGSPRWVRLAAAPDTVALWSARSLEADSAAARFAGPLAPWVLRALPDAHPSRVAGDPPAPLAEPYEVSDEAMHLSYAVQWFAFALILAGGSLALALRRRHG